MNSWEYLLALEQMREVNQDLKDTIATIRDMNKRLQDHLTVMQAENIINGNA